jgi:hypothetical protein
LLSLGKDWYSLIRIDKDGIVYDIILSFAKRSPTKLDYYPSRFFWQGDSDKNKYRLVK